MGSPVSNKKFKVTSTNCYKSDLYKYFVVIFSFLVALGRGLNPQSFQYGRVLRVVCYVILFVGVHGGSSSLANDQHAPGLVAIPRKIPSQAQGVSFSLRLLPFSREEARNQLQEADPLEAKLLEALLTFVDKQFPSEEFSLKELFQAQRLKTDPNESNIVFFKLGQNGRNLFGRQPTKSSSEPPEKHNDTGVGRPKLSKGDLVATDCRRDAKLRYLCWIHL